MTTGRVIKKYPNRRLYDTEESRYITLADVRDLVLNGTDFAVIDKKSGQDITRCILLQVISEQEQQGEPIMSEDFLSQVIRSYGKVMPGFVARYLSHSLELFLTQQQPPAGRAKDLAGGDTVPAAADDARENFERWRTLQDEVLQHFAGGHEDAGREQASTAGKDCKKVG